jgi:hypothetical protein
VTGERYGLAIRGDDIVAVRVVNGARAASVSAVRELDAAPNDDIASSLESVRGRRRDMRVGVVVADRRVRAGVLHGEALSSQQDALGRLQRDASAYFAGAREGLTLTI